MAWGVLLLFVICDQFSVINFLRSICDQFFLINSSMVIGSMGDGDM